MRFPNDDETQLTQTSIEGSETDGETVPGLTIVWHPDPSRVGERAPLPTLATGRPVQVSRTRPVFTAGDRDEPRPLDDRSISRQPMTLRPGAEPGTITLDLGDSRSRVQADGEAVVRRRDVSAAEVDRGVVLQLGRWTVVLLHTMPLHLSTTGPTLGFVGQSAGMAHVRDEVRRLADLDLPVLVRGATGTGKELVARALHDHGRRRGQPFVAVNMATVAPSLAAAELFGAVRGAYTGATQDKVGFFEHAEGGTLFLDEIGETPSEVQPMLLRALETGEILKVGRVEPTPIDVRVIAATDAHLGEAISDGRFRAPLLHRLAGYEIDLPSLAERRDDISPLLVHWLDDALRDAGQPPLGEGDGRPWPAAGVVARLVRHGWPGNVRELRNIARWLVITGRHCRPDELASRLEARLTLDDASVQASSAPRSAEAARPASAGPTRAAAPKRRRLRRPEEVGIDELRAALAEHRYEIQATAKALGVSRANLYRLIDTHPSIRKAAMLDREEIDAALARHQGDLARAALDLEVSARGLKQRMTALESSDS